MFLQGTGSWGLLGFGREVGNAILSLKPFGSQAIGHRPSRVLNTQATRGDSGFRPLSAVCGLRLSARGRQASPSPSVICLVVGVYLCNVPGRSSILLHTRIAARGSRHAPSRSINRRSAELPALRLGPTAHAPPALRLPAVSAAPSQPPPVCLRRPTLDSGIPTLCGWWTSRSVKQEQAALACFWVAWTC
jgi:hypothetical protein